MDFSTASQAIFGPDKVLENDIKPIRRPKYKCGLYQLMNRGLQIARPEMERQWINTVEELYADENELKLRPAKRREIWRMAVSQLDDGNATLEKYWAARKAETPDMDVSHDFANDIMIDTMSLLPFATLDLGDDEVDILRGFDLALGHDFELEDEMRGGPNDADPTVDEFLQTMGHMEDILGEEVDEGAEAEIEEEAEEKTEDKGLKGEEKRLEFIPFRPMREFKEIENYDDDDDAEEKTEDKGVKGEEKRLEFIPFRPKRKFKEIENYDDGDDDKEAEEGRRDAKRRAV